MPWHAKATALFALLWILSGSSPQVFAQSSHARNQHQIEEQLDQLQKDIELLQQSLASKRSDHLAEQNRLRELDLGIQQTSQAIRGLEGEILRQESALAELEKQRDEQLQQLEVDQQQLAKQIGGTYRLARESRLKLILNQDSPAELGRLLAYYNYINKAQAGKIDQLRETLARLELTHAQISRQLEVISEAQAKQQQELATKQEQREARNKLVAELNQQIGSDQARLEEFERNRRDLEQLLEKLTDVLADIPADLGEHLSVSAQKGQLNVPVKATVSKAFGQKRGSGTYWQGWVFDAEQGADVHNIAYGRVAFADWLRGYGLMIIIDHGEGFMSLYGYNESLLWEAGDWVEPGNVIATVGANSSGTQGLYFELRKDGKALDPAAWLKR